MEARTDDEGMTGMLKTVHDAVMIAWPKYEIVFEVTFFDPTARDPNTVQVSMHVNGLSGVTFASGGGVSLAAAIGALHTSAHDMLVSHFNRNTEFSDNVIKSKAEERDRFDVSIRMLRHKTSEGNEKDANRPDDHA